MANFWKQLKQWFAEEAESSPSKPFVREWLERTEKEEKDLFSWQLGMAALEINGLVFSQFKSFLESKKNGHNVVFFLKNRSSGGFMFYFSQTEYSLRDARRFMDFLNKKVKENSYKTQVADYRLYTKNDLPERLERFYLKPKLLPPIDGKAQQLFGNILIELIIREEQPKQLKFMATTYTDHKFTEGKPFEELMELIFT